MSTAGAPLTRRSMLAGGAALAGYLVVGIDLSTNPLARAGEAPVDVSLNAFLRITPDSKITMVMPAVEMGQGSYTSMAMILAEELDIDLDQVRLEHAPPDRSHYVNPALGDQITGGSTTILAWFVPLRKAGASARSMLLQAAAELWNIPADALRTSAGLVVHDRSNRSATYGELVTRMSPRLIAPDLPLKSARDFKLIGTSAKRLDTAAKVNGHAVYGIDVMLPGMKFATLASSPVLGGKVLHVDDTRAKRISGVRQIVVLDDMVAVVADHMWAAMQGLEVLEVRWDDGPYATAFSDGLWSALEKGSAAAGATAKKKGDAVGQLAGARVFDATFELPFLAHAAMEPMNCTVHVRPDGCEVWVGTQAPLKAQSAAARSAGLDPDKVTIHNHLIGGGFGRRLEVDGVAKAVRIARHVDGPVKIVWSREEDIRQDYFRPLYHLRTRAKVEDGKIIAWHHRITGPSILSRWVPVELKDGVDEDAIGGAVETPYDFPNMLVEYVRHEIPEVPTSFWRGVGPNANVFAAECLIDRIARELKADPVEFRRRMITDKPRARAVLDLAASKAGWSTPLQVPKAGGRVGRGIALLAAFGSFLATVAEVVVADDGEVTVSRVVTAADVGTIINPDTLTAQVEGGVVFGIGAVLHGQITIAGGKVQQSNFHDYRVTRINEMPAMECHFVKNDESPGGIGEPGTVTIQAAVANAVFAATGVSLSRMPINRSLIAKRAI